MLPVNASCEQSFIAVNCMRKNDITINIKIKKKSQIVYQTQFFTIVHKSCQDADNSSIFF